jgi:hypothetical protein
MSEAAEEYWCPYDDDDDDDDDAEAKEWLANRRAAMAEHYRAERIKTGLALLADLDNTGKACKRTKHNRNHLPKKGKQ